MLAANRRTLVRYAVAAGAVLVATLVRWFLDFWLQSHHPLTFYYCAVAIAVWFGGFGPALFAVFAGFLVADWFFVEPRFSLGLTDAHSVALCSTYAVTNLIIIVFSRASHTAYQKATSRATESINLQLQRRVAELESLLNLVPVGVAIAEDCHCRKMRPNRAMAEMLKTPLERNISVTAASEEKPPWRICREGRELTGDDLPFQRSAAHGIEVREEPCQCVFDDGRVLEFQVYATPLFDEAGHSRGCIGVMVDITHRRRLEEDLRKRAEQLAEADRRKDEYLAMLGHELRNPLAGILNGVQVIRMAGTHTQEEEEMCGVIERQAAHMARLVDDLLDVARISSGKVQLRRERLDLVDLVRRTAENHRHCLELHDLEMTLNLHDEPLWVKGDPTRLSEILGNLIHNADKFTDAGGQVAVSVTRGADEKTATVTVRDTGIGLEPEMLGRIFQPFNQADRSLDRTRGGLGLGLALVKGLVELHGGQVTARSSGHGQGSEFSVCLPLESEAQQTPTAAESSRLPFPCYRILLIDDRRDAILPMQKMLKRLGQEVATATDGRSGLATAKEFHPDLVLCDIGLPDMDGYAVARALRADPDLQSVYLVAVTGYGQEEDRRRAIEAGFDDHIAKPVAKDQLQGLLLLLPRLNLQYNGRLQAGNDASSPLG